MFVLPGTCKEIKGDEQVQKRNSKKKKAVTKDASTDSKEKPEEDKPEVDKPEVEKEQLVAHKYDLNEKWSQTMDFPRKKKGTQSDPILTQDSYAQVTSKDLLL
jgi:hypothetical protein